jgi:hypothetical protein
MPISRPLRLLFCLAVLFASTACAAEREFRWKEGTSGEGKLDYVNGLPVLFLSGTPEEIGRQQGELVGDQIKPLLEMPRQTLAEHGHDRAWPVVGAMSRILMHNSPEAYRRELDAFIETGKLDRDSLYVGNTLVELRRMGGCSSFVAMPERSATGELLFGRNFDFPPLGVLDEYHCILVVKPEGKRPYVSIGYPGMIGVISGMNDAGLVAATLDVYESSDGSPYFDATGVPLAFTYRRVLEECATVDEAKKLLESVGRTTYMNLAVADRERAVVFELTPERVGMREAEQGVAACTNHFQLDGLKTNRQCKRIVKLDALNERKEKFDIESIQQALHSVNQGIFTLQTMVFEPASLRLHVAMGGPGPVSNKPMKTLDVGPWLRSEADDRAHPAAAAGR